MMPDLDRYAGTVLGAYAVTLLLLALLIGLSVWRSAKVAGQLERMEARGGRARGEEPK